MAVVLNRDFPHCITIAHVDTQQNGRHASASSFEANFKCIIFGDDRCCAV